MHLQAGSFLKTVHSATAIKIELASVHAEFAWDVQGRRFGADMAGYNASSEAELNSSIAAARGTADSDTITVTTRAPNSTPTQTPVSLTGTLDVRGAAGSGSLTLNGNLNGTGGVSVSGFTGGNTATFTGALTQTGGFTVADGSAVTIAQTGSFNAADGVILNGGTFTNQGAVTATRTLGGNAVTGGTTAATTVVNTTGARIEGQASGVIQNTANVPGALTVNNAGRIQGNEYDGVTQHGTGALTVTNAGTGVIYGQNSRASANGYGVGSDAGGALTLTNDAGGKIVGQYGVVGSNTADSVTNSGTIAAGILNGDGTITAGGRSGIRLRSGGTVMNRASGEIQGTSGLFVTGATTIDNAGTITGIYNASFTFASNSGILLGGSGTVGITNSGTISGGLNGIFTDNIASGTIINTAAGAIRGNRTGNGIYVRPGVQPFLISNAGEISSNTTAGSQAFGVILEGPGHKVVNTGMIQADAGLVSGGTTAGTTTVINGATGTIAGTTFGVQTTTTSGTLALTNYGTITGGSSVLSSSANTVSLMAGSSVTGALRFGAGNDTVTLYTGTRTAGAVVDAATGLTLQQGNTTYGAATIGTLDLGLGTNTLNLRGTGDGSVANGAVGRLDLSTVSGASALNKQDAGTFVLSGTYAGTAATAVSGGTLLVNGSIAGSAVSVASGGTLGGSGTTGTVDVASGGTLAAGNSPGIISTGNLSLAAGATLSQEINGTTLGTNYDQINVTGTVRLAGATLNLSFGSFTSSAGNRFVIINNDGSDPITGAGGTGSPSFVYGGSTLTEGSTFTANNRTYQISYQGVGGQDGVANDVTLTDVTPPPGPDPDPLPPGPTPGNDNLVGTAGADTISLMAGNDTFTGGGGADLVYGNQGDDLIYGNLDNDTLYGGQGDDRVYGGQGDDRVLGNAGNDMLFGNAGNDVIYGNQGADVVYGNQGQDALFGGQDNDTLFGGQDADIVYGNLGADIVYGNQGADILYGGQGNDVLYGGQGDDTLAGGLGDDILVGGLGADRYVFGLNSGRDLILGFDQGDRIALGGQTYTVSSAQNGDALLTLSGGGVVDLVGIRADQVNTSYFAA